MESPDGADEHFSSHTTTSVRLSLLTSSALPARSGCAKKLAVASLRRRARDGRASGPSRRAEGTLAEDVPVAVDFRAALH
jgi:hypothetical protein